MSEKTQKLCKPIFISETMKKKKKHEQKQHEFRRIKFEMGSCGHCGNEVQRIGWIRRWEYNIYLLQQIKS